MVIAFFAIASAMTSALALPSYDNNGTVTLYNSNSGYWTDAINNGYIAMSSSIDGSATAGNSTARMDSITALGVTSTDILNGNNIKIFQPTASGNYITFSVPPTAPGDMITSVTFVLGDFSNGATPWTITYKDASGSLLGSANVLPSDGIYDPFTYTATPPLGTTSFTLVGTANMSDNRFYAAQYVYEPASSTELGVTITGNPIVGQTLTANVSPSGATVTYQWEANGADISGAVNSTYIPVSGDVGKTITVTVTGTGSYAGTATSAATAAVTNAAPAPPYDVNGTVTLYNSNSGYWTNAINNGYLKMSISSIDGTSTAGYSGDRMGPITALGITESDIINSSDGRIKIFQPTASGNYITFSVPPTAQGDVITSITLVLADYSGGSGSWTITYNDADGNHIGSTETITISTTDDPHVYTNTTPPTGTTSFTLVGTANSANNRFYAAQYVYGPEALVIGPGETKTASDYTGGDIIIQSEENPFTGEISTGQLDLEGNDLKVNGVVKFEQAFTSGKWYAVGFPFEVASMSCGGVDHNLKTYDATGAGGSYGDFWLKNNYDRNTNKFAYTDPSTSIQAGGYILQVPDDISERTITFTSGTGITLSSSTTFATKADDYLITNNPSFANIPVTNASITSNVVSSGDSYYTYQSKKPNNFDLALSWTLRPFESLVIANNVLLRSDLGGENVTALPAVNPADDKAVSTEYYTLTGVKVAQPSKGNIYVVKTVFESGKTSVVKQFIEK